MPKYLLNTGLSWKSRPDLEECDMRAEAGETRDDLAKGSVSWLLEQGLISKVQSDSGASKEAPAPVAIQPDAEPSASSEPAAEGSK